MNTILFLEASPHGDNSLGAHLAREVITLLQTQHPHARVVLRDLIQSALPVMSADYARALVAMQPNTEPAFACSEQLIGELEQSDCLVISTPMHNFTVPAALKLWIDFVLRAGRTFRSTVEGKLALLADRPALVLVRSGGVCTGEGARQPDFLTPYLKEVLAVIGITTVEFIYLAGVAPDDRAVDTIRSKLAESLLLTYRSGVTT